MLSLVPFVCLLSVLPLCTAAGSVAVSLCTCILPALAADCSARLKLRDTEQGEDDRTEQITYVTPYRYTAVGKPWQRYT